MTVKELHMSVRVAVDAVHRCNWQTVRTLKNPQLVFYGLFVFLQNKL